MCGNNVTDISAAYAYSAVNGDPVAGPKVRNISYTYLNCSTVAGNMYLNYKENTSSKNVNATACFSYPYGGGRKNIFVYKDYAWDNWLYNIGNLVCSFNDMGVPTITKVTWTDMENGYYNTTYSIYVYNNL